MRSGCFMRPASRAGVLAETPEEIRAHGAADRAAGVLREHQLIERLRLVSGQVVAM